MNIKKCAYCGKQYETDTNTKYCSEVCKQAKEEERKQEYAKTKTRICKRCGREFQVQKLANGNYSHRIYCSDACSNYSTKLKQPQTQTTKPTKICAFCGKEFEIPQYTEGAYIGKYKYDKKYCSDKCRDLKLEEDKKQYQANKKRICAFCGKEFIVPRIADGHFSETIFCSDDCRYAGTSNSQLVAQRQREKTCMEKYGVIYPCLTKQCREANFSAVISNINKQFADYLKQKNIEVEFEFPLQDKSYDMLIKNTKILVEVDPTYTHTTVGNHYSNWKPDESFKTKQLDKTLIAKENGYRCIHIWDWDDWNKIFDIITDEKIRLYARKLELKEITKQQAKVNTQD